MNTLRSIVEVRRQVREWKRCDHSIGLVPTMGGLHEGHLALVKRSVTTCDRTLVTVFVNPIQFAPGDDFAAYPRRESRDARLLKGRGCDCLFTPTVEELFPHGHSDERFSTRITVRSLRGRLCGSVRPGHFDAVGTQVLKLLMITAPDKVFFGEKDYQQLLVVRRSVRDLDVPVSVIGVPTVREPDGLALSSRNVYLTDAERQVAPGLHRVLLSASRALACGRDAKEVCQDCADTLLEQGFDRVDYVELVDPESLQPLERVGAAARLMAAVWLGRARLIDNLEIESQT